ncbi:antitoxin HicB [Alicyclobacillus acidoterrestris]|uniref:type II toxin-antitoxin system HicB family antitoxin n=1 Tax=Alicyclobacillus suci TaxID=2816080 RepID=UPI001194FB68|nr:toxin-antitoxin system HicB family antitoxin [Alicyclobacillus suci]GEO27317.1 antitoxin HicB [Alicyclobacillus acidoterrestris]
MEKDIEYYMALPYTITIIPDTISGGYVAKVNELPGCLTQSDSLNNLAQLIEDAKRGWIEIALEDGRPIPEPSVHGEYSGKFNVRVPKSLHRELAERAEKEGVSLNQYIVYQLSRDMGLSNDKASD